MSSRLVLVLSILAALAVLALPWPLPAPAPIWRHLQVEARSFAYEPAVIRVNRGDRISLQVESVDVTHGFYLDGYDLDVLVKPGQRAHLEFVADRPGKFRFRCSVSCGSLHPFMIGELIVEPNTPFWRAVGLTVISAAGLVAYLTRQEGEV